MTKPMIMVLENEGILWKARVLKGSTFDRKIMRGRGHTGYSYLGFDLQGLVISYSGSRVSDIVIYSYF